MKLFFRKYGEGPVIFILHGLYGSSDNWVSIAKAISNRFTVYLPDLRNHGNSPHSDIHDYDSMSNDIIELAGNLGIDRYFLAGHSMGGKTAISVAIKCPWSILGLVVADISPITDPVSAEAAKSEHIHLLQSLAETDLSSAKRRQDIEIRLSEKIRDQSTRGLIMKNLQRNSDNSFSWKLNTGALISNIDKITGSLDLKPGISEQITGFPVLFLKGEFSDYITDSQVHDIIKIFPGAEIKIIKNAGHWLQADNPEAVIKVLIDLLNY